MIFQKSAPYSNMVKWSSTQKVVLFTLLYACVQCISGQDFKHSVDVSVCALSYIETVGKKRREISSIHNVGYNHC